ncbi:MAG TPA: tetratricopeptide repeat protein [Pirellulaceae bacterium]|nr:tetratricopeptide repeat protein [Pirellulaceae bacterium]
MFAARPLRMEWEFIKWLALLTIAASLALLATRAASGNDFDLPREPALLPTTAVQTARPMPVTQYELADPNLQLWRILEQHRAGQPEEALTGWEQLALPCETEVWQQVAMALAELQLGQLEPAAEHLDRALQIEPRNPVAHYVLAILRLEQARNAKEWYDAIGPVQLRFAAYRPREVVPNTSGMYELNAMMELEQAIAHAGDVDRTRFLLPPQQQLLITTPAATVGDLLVALGADKFEPQAHNVLGTMCLERGAYEQAEEHMDAAHTAGLTVVFGYQDLGAAYQREGRHAEAFRAYLKSIGNDPGVLHPLQHALENAGRAILDR